MLFLAAMFYLSASAIEAHPMFEWMQGKWILEGERIEYRQGADSVRVSIKGTVMGTYYSAEKYYTSENTHQEYRNGVFNAEKKINYWLRQTECIDSVPDQKTECFKSGWGLDPSKGQSLSRIELKDKVLFIQERYKLRDSHIDIASQTHFLGDKVVFNQKVFSQNTVISETRLEYKK